MKLITLILCLFTFSVSAQGNKEYLAVKHDFRGHVVGSSLEENKDLVPYNDDAVMSARFKVYINPNEDLTFGNGRLKNVLYGFYEGKLAVIRIDSNDVLGDVALEKTARDLYGDGTGSKYAYARDWSHLNYSASIVDIDVWNEASHKKEHRMRFYLNESNLHSRAWDKKGQTF